MTAGRRGESLTAAGGVVGWKMTAGCMGRGEVGRQQGWRMTAGQRGESLTAVGGVEDHCWVGRGEVGRQQCKHISALCH